MEPQPFTAASTERERFLAQLRRQEASRVKEVIYGVYDNSRASIWTKLNDWYIDRQKVSLKEKSYFFHMLAVMVDAGIPLMQALKILARRTSSQRFQRVLFTAAYDISRGLNFSDALSRFSEVFNEFEVGIIRSGEAVGHLEQVLSRLSSELEESYELSLKLWTASFYPIIVFVVLVFVAVGMIFFLLPNLLSLLQESGFSEENLPLTTKILVGVRDAIANFWWFILIIIFALYTAVKVYVQSEGGRFQWDFWKLRLPIVGELIRKVIVLKFVRLISLLLESGFPVLGSLKIVAMALPNEVYRLKMWEVMAKVQEGEKISDNLANAPFLFPETVTQMLAVGEQSAALAQTAEKVSGQYQKEITHTLKRLTAVFEPVMIIVVGVFVALLALAILLPIFRIVGGI